MSIATQDCERIAQLEQENKELKAHVEYLIDVVDEVSTVTNANTLPQETLDLAANAIASVPEQSLAQHDKELIFKFVKGLFDKNGLLISRGSIVYFRDGFIEQLQEQR